MSTNDKESNNNNTNKPSTKSIRDLLLDASSTDSESENEGIYGRKLNQTKKEIQQLHTQQNLIDGLLTSLCFFYYFLSEINY